MGPEKQSFRDSINLYLALAYYNNLTGLSDNCKQCFYCLDKIIKPTPFVKRVLGMMFEFGHATGNLTEINLKTAEKYYREASKEGDSRATVYLGMLYEEGRGVDKNLKTATELYEQAANSGDLVGMRYSAMMYRWGVGVELDLKRAAELFEKAANLGDEQSLAHIGEMYLRGLGVVRNVQKGLENLKRAVKLGVDYGEEILARMQLSSELDDDETRNRVEKRVLKKPLELQEKQRIHHIARAFEKGIEGAERNLDKAASLYEAAAKLGEPWSLRSLGELYEAGNFYQKDMKRAAECYKEAAKLGDMVSYRFLGELYESGNGVEKDPKRAFEIYREASDKNDRWSALHAGLMCEAGNGTARDHKSAYEYYQKAANAGVLQAKFCIAGFPYARGLGDIPQLENEEITALEKLGNVSENNFNEPPFITVSLGNGLEAHFNLAAITKFTLPPRLTTWFMRVIRADLSGEYCEEFVDKKITKEQKEKLAISRKIQFIEELKSKRATWHIHNIFCEIQRCFSLVYQKDEGEYFTLRVRFLQFMLGIGVAGRNMLYQSMECYSQDKFIMKYFKYLILQGKFDLEPHDFNGNSCLTHMLKKNRPDLAKFVLELGSSPTTLDSHHDLPERVADRKCDKEMVRLMKISQFLLSHIPFIAERIAYKHQKQTRDVELVKREALDKLIEAEIQGLLVLFPAEKEDHPWWSQVLKTQLQMALQPRRGLMVETFKLILSQVKMTELAIHEERLGNPFLQLLLHRSYSDPYFYDERCSLGNKETDLYHRERTKEIKIALQQFYVEALSNAYYLRLCFPMLAMIRLRMEQMPQQSQKQSANGSAQQVSSSAASSAVAVSTLSNISSTACSTISRSLNNISSTESSSNTTAVSTISATQVSTENHTSDTEKRPLLMLKESAENERRKEKFKVDFYTRVRQNLTSLQKVELLLLFSKSENSYTDIEMKTVEELMEALGCKINSDNYIIFDKEVVLRPKNAYGFGNLTRNVLSKGSKEEILEIFKGFGITAETLKLHLDGDQSRWVHGANATA